MWKLSKDKVRLHELVYIPDPHDGYKYALLRPTFTTGTANDVRHWDNNAIHTSAGVKALIVLTAWLVGYEHGFATYLRVTWRDDSRCELLIHFMRNNNPYGTPSRHMLREDKLPPYIREALGTVKRELEASYGTDDYLDI